MAIEGKRCEQVALSRLLDIAWGDFDKSLLSAGARFVLWRSFSSKEALIANHLSARGKSNLLDGRRTEKSRTDEENNLIAAVDDAASEAIAYLDWARNHGGGQPILRESLVSYCFAFEGCLKNVAVAFALAETRPDKLKGIAFVPDEEFKNVLKKVKLDWKNCGASGKFRARVFFDEFIFKRNPDIHRYPFYERTSDEDWEVCQAAFDLRNAIVHQMSRPTEQINLAGTIFDPHCEIELKMTHLRAARISMKKLLDSLDPEYIDLGF
jgi:hypothetical protein